MKKSGLSRSMRVLAVAAAIFGAMVVPAARAHAAEVLNDKAWDPGAQWLSLRFGYAKEEGKFSPNGNIGGGFGYSRMVSKRLSMGVNLQHDLLGKFGGGALIAIPATFEVLWHFKWNTPLRPYVGGGMQAVYRKTYRTGADNSTMEPGYCFSIGANAPIDKAHVLGLDTRIASVSNLSWSTDPVFLTRRPENILVSVKLSYSLTY